MKLKKNVLGLMTTAAVVGLILTACFTANLSGSASSPSPILPVGPSGSVGPWAGKTVQFNLVSKASFASGLGGTTGGLKDAGTNVLFPRGVKISFRNGISLGLGFDCTDFDDIGGPARLVHGGSSIPNPSDLCQYYNDPRVWFGMVTYSSAEPRYYPNQGFLNCNDYYQEYLGVFGSAFFFRKPVTKSSGSTSGENISGFGFVTIVDTNYNHNYDHGDRFSFVPVCGPYTHLDGSAILTNQPLSQPPALDLSVLPASLQTALKKVGTQAPAPKSTIYPSDPTQYNYISCLAGGPTLAGAVSSLYIDSTPIYALYLSMYCAFWQPGTAGDLKIGIGARLTTTSSSTSLP